MLARAALDEPGVWLRTVSCHMHGPCHGNAGLDSHAAPTGRTSDGDREPARKAATPKKRVVVGHECMLYVCERRDMEIHLENHAVR